MSDIDIITVRWDAERDVYKVNRPNWSGGEVVLWSAVKTMLASQAAEVARLTKENDWLRAYTGQSAKACVYCGLGADEMGKCERGFPGCARADDQMLCREVGVAIERDALQAEVARLTDVLRRGGFVECDIPACNCGGWHHRYGLPERWAEITQALIDADVLGNSTGNKPLNAIKRLADERDALLARVEAAEKAIERVLPAKAREHIDCWKVNYGLDRYDKVTAARRWAEAGGPSDGPIMALATAIEWLEST